MKKFIDISILGEYNIGVIDLGKIDYSNTNQLKTSVVEPKLIEALEAHFDCTVKIISCDVSFENTPITGKAYVLIGSEEEDEYKNVDLNQTWVY